MDPRTRRSIAAIVLAALAGAFVALASAETSALRAAPPDTAPISAAERAAGARFAAAVAPSDRAWIEAAIAAARPEAQSLIAEVDGLVEFQTHRGDPLGVTRSLVSSRGASFAISFDIASLDGRRVVDRESTVMHELGHAIDHALVPQATNDVLEAGIPRTGTCGNEGGSLTGSCTAPEERFADTFAKWALRGRVSIAGAGYQIATPRSLEDWGAPLATLAAERAAQR